MRRRLTCSTLSVLVLAFCSFAVYAQTAHDIVDDEGITVSSTNSTIDFIGKAVKCTDVSGTTDCVIDTGVYYVDDFVGDSPNDLGDKIEKCVDSLPDEGGTCDASRLTGNQTFAGMTLPTPMGSRGQGASFVTIIFGDANYTVTDTIWIKDTISIHIRGQRAPVDQLNGTRFLWDGGDTGAMFELQNVGRSVFEDFSIRADTGVPLQYGIRMSNVTGTTPTARIFRNIRVSTKNATNNITDAFIWDWECSGCMDANNDLDSLYNVQVRGYTNAGFHIKGGQSKTHGFYNCSFFGGDTAQPPIPDGDFGVLAEKGSFRWYGGGGGGFNDVADYRIASNFDPIVISGCNLENSKRLLEVGFSSTQMPVTVTGCRWAGAGNLNSDEKAILYERAGGLQLIGNHITNFDGDDDSDLQIFFKGYTDGDNRPTAIAIGNNIGSTKASDEVFTTSFQGRWVLQSNSRSVTSGSPSVTVGEHIPDQALEVSLIGDTKAPPCATGDYRIWADDGMGQKKLRKCENGGTASNLDTGPSPDCSGTTTYQDGEGDCNDIDPVYENELNDSAGLAAALSDEFGTGRAVFHISPQIDHVLLVDDEGELRLGEEDLNGVEYIRFNVPSQIVSNRTCTLLDADAILPDSCIESTIARDTEIHAPDYASFYEAGTTTVDGTTRTLDFDMTKKNSDGAVFSLSAGQVTVNKTSTFAISFDAGMCPGTLDLKFGKSDAWLEVDTGGGFAEVTGSRVGMATNRLFAYSGSSRMIMDVTATPGDIFRVRVQRIGGSNSVTTCANRSRFNFEEK